MKADTSVSEEIKIFIKINLKVLERKKKLRLEYPASGKLKWKIKQGEKKKKGLKERVSKLQPCFF